MSWLLETSLISALAACLVFLGCRAFRPRPALAHLLWLAVLVTLLCPPLLRWSLPFDPAGVFHRPGAARTETRPPALPARLPSLAPARASSSLPPGEAGVSAPGGMPWRELLLALWGCGSALVLLAMLRGFLRVRRFGDSGCAAPDWLRHELVRLSQRLQVAPPEVRVVPAIGSAFLLSLPRPRLYWPAATLEGTGRQQLRGVLAHELAHIRRRDHWVTWLEAVAVVGLWWHPLVWIVRAALRQQAELACDAWAVWAVPAARQAYAGALIDALHTRAVVAVPVLGARPGARRAFEERLQMILNENVPCGVSRWALVPVLALCVPAVSGFSAAQERARRSETEGTRIEQQVRREVLRVVNQELRAKLGRRYQVDDLEDVREVVRAYVQAELKKAREAKPRERRAPRDEPREGPRRRPAAVRNRRALEREGEPFSSGLRSALQEGLQEALREIRNDKDLRELGLTRDVERLVETLLTGKGDFELDQFLHKAIRAGLRMAKKEVRNDPDLQQLGIADDVEKLLDGLLGGNGQLEGGLATLIQKAVRGGLQMAREELRRDPDLQRLGIAGDVERLLESLLDGKNGDFGRNLEDLIQKAIRGALEEARKDGDAKARRELEGAPRRRPARKPRRLRLR